MRAGEIDSSSTSKTTSISAHYTNVSIFSEACENAHTLEKFDVYKSTGQIKTEEIKTADGVKKRVIAADKEFVESLYHTTLRLNFTDGEKLFGLGQAEEGVWNLRETTQYLHQANKKIAIPFLISSNGYGLLFTTQSPAIFCDSKAYGSYFYTNADYFLDYFFIAPDSFTQIIARMRSLTGKATMPPKYALGYIQSQKRYESQEEILATAAEFKKRNIPLSLIVLDWLSWEDGMWGQKSFDKSRFPDVPAMVEKLHKDNVHFMISIWPTMAEQSENYKEMKEKGTLLTGVNICNAFEPAARQLYWTQAKRGLADYGVESWWCDSSEPVTPEWNHYEKQTPEKTYNEYLQVTSDIMPPQKANAYGLYHARGMFEGQKKDFPDRRMLILTRSGYPGSQQYGIALWSGDTSAKWSVLKNQVVQACQFGLTGIPYWTVDIGAFFVKRGAPWYWDGDYPDASENQAYKKLYIRWFQFGAFLPMFRAHGTDCRREPWAFCDKTNIYYDILVKFIRLRYELMPYIYSVAARVWKDDESFIRPLFMEFSDNACFDICSQYMFGPSIMVCPVTNAMYFNKEGQELTNIEKTIDVYLPNDCSWYDWWTGKKYDGGQWIKADAPLEKIPIFVKEGSIIPVERDGKLIPLRFTDKQGNCEPFELYEDNGDGNDYLDGNYTITKLK
ncbi:MAG: hypothetical protein K6A43_12615 [Treponema sp.]|nr:hypothetical protein [Treponema sp.]